MERYFAEEHYLLKEMVADFAVKEVLPVAVEIDESMRFPAEHIPKMAELGLLGIVFPEQYGGAGMDTLSYAIAVEELAKVCASTAITVAAHVSLGSNPIYMFGTEAQKEKFLTPLASGKMLGAFGLTEPNAGSDSGGTQTTAVEDGDEYIINGGKIFITNAGVSGLITITAVTDKSQGTKGITNFMVPTDTKGLSIGKKEDKMGWRGSDTRQLYFEDMRIPKANILGLPGEGFKQFMITLDTGRIGVAALSLGLAEAAFQAAKQYSKEREAFGKPIHTFQSISFKLADMAVMIENARHLVYHAAWLKDQGKPFKKEAAIAKLYASEAAMKITTEAVQVHGGYGYVKEFPVERYFRDAKILEIGEGTSEIQRLVIARECLKD